MGEPESTKKLILSNLTSVMLVPIGLSLPVGGAHYLLRYFTGVSILPVFMFIFFLLFGLIGARISLHLELLPACAIWIGSQALASVVAPFIRLTLDDNKGILLVFAAVFLFIAELFGGVHSVLRELEYESVMFTIIALIVLSASFLFFRWLFGRREKAKQIEPPGDEMIDV